MMVLERQAVIKISLDVGLYPTSGTISINKLSSTVVKSIIKYTDNYPGNKNANKNIHKQKAYYVLLITLSSYYRENNTNY